MKIDKSLCLFYFPTTVMIIDNDNDFVSDLNNYLNKNHINTIPFAFTNSFLNYIDNYIQPISINNLLVKNSAYFSEESLYEIQKIIYNQNRFNQISVLILDYEMPGINGIELSAMVKIPNVKKIILTNKATEKIAIDAFNKKMIDAFVFKEDLFDSLIITIEKLQYEYFYNISLPLHYLCNFTKEPFLKNLINIELENYSPIEYYILNKNGSFVMFDNELNASLLIIEDSKYFDKMLLNKSILTKKTIENLEKKSCIYISNQTSSLFKTKEITIPCNKINGVFDDYYYAVKNNINNTETSVNYKKNL